MTPPLGWRPARWAIPLLMLTVAAGQQYLAHGRQVSPWVGAGFGMFATVDGEGRGVVVVAPTPAGPERLPIPEPLEERARRLAVAPFPGAMRRFAADFKEAVNLPAGQPVRVEVWRPAYHPRTAELDWELVTWAEG